MFQRLSTYICISRRMRSTTCIAPRPRDENTRVTILNNGVRVATEFRPEPLASVALVAEAGPRFETALNNGISHILGRMAFKGFTTLPQPDLDDKLLTWGSRLAAETMREHQLFQAITLPDGVPELVDMLTRIITDLTLDPRVLEKEQKDIRLEMIDADNDPRAVVFDYLHCAAFQGTPLAQPVIGPSKNMGKFTRAFAADFLHQHYQPYKLCMVASGPVEHEALVSWTDSRLGHLKGEASCQSDDGPCRFTGSQIVYRDDSMPLAHVAVAVEAPGFGDREYLPLLVASCITGEWDRSRAGLENNAPTMARASACTNFCERYESFYLAYRDVGLWGVYFVSPRMHLDDMLMTAQEEWMKLCLMTQHGDVERGVNTAKLLLAQRNLGVSRTVCDLATELLYTCARRSLQEKFEALSDIKAKDIRESCSKILYDRCPAVAAVGPTETLPDYVRTCSGQYWLRT